MGALMDLLGLGCVAIDDCYLLEDYPAEDSKQPVLAKRRSLGGTTATALAAAACYGGRCAYAGRLDRQAGEFVINEFGRLGVDISLVQHAPGIRPIRTQVIVSRRTSSRTVLFDLSDAAGASDDWPAEDDLRSTKVLLVDHFGMEGMLRAARIARAAGIPTVADFEAHQRPEFPELLSLIDHLFVSQALATQITGCAQPTDACQALWSSQRKAVIVTSGRAGCTYRSADDAAAVYLPAFPVSTVDTTGCGDVFRGIYAAALVAGLPLHRRLLEASAAAALLASRPFGDAAVRLPTRMEVEAFIAQCGGTS